MPLARVAHRSTYRASSVSRSPGAPAIHALGRTPGHLQRRARVRITIPSDRSNLRPSVSSWTSVAAAAGAAAIVVADLVLELVLKLTLVLKLAIIVGCHSRDCRRRGCRRSGRRSRGRRSRRRWRADRLRIVFRLRGGRLLRTGADDDVHGATRFHLRSGSWMLFDHVTRRHLVVRDLHLAAELQTRVLEDLLRST